jgi:hypothetical protein
MTSQQKSSGSRKERDKEREVENNRREAQDALARGIEILSLHRPTHTHAVEQASSRGSHPDEVRARSPRHGGARVCIPVCSWSVVPARVRSSRLGRIAGKRRGQRLECARVRTACSVARAL